MTEISAMAKEAARIVRKGWTQGCMATNKDGRTVSVISKGATNFCAYGAMIKAAQNLKMSYHLVAAKFVNEVDDCITEYNDEVAKSAEDVAQIFDRIADNEQS